MNLTPQQMLRLRTVAALSAELAAHTSSAGNKRGLDTIARVPREQYQLNAAPQVT
jgi:hypothetical protein